MVQLGNNTSILELWHGPTAAFKDMALQIMPYLLQVSKEKNHNSAHTVILVATSGDTGKAALEGFKDCKDISIIVFYPEGGVSEIQQLQMSTTDGSNTYVLAVKGNFDDCQSGVKRIFSDLNLRKELASKNFEFSSANSINWGRLCPQIVYYVHSYATLLNQKVIHPGEQVNFCVPTGNFGNILAGYYAKRMGLPINKLICASNQNNVLADFFATGTYDANREFFKTNSPSMDILISSNLERFLFEITGHDSAKINEWYDALSKTGRFTVDTQTKQAMDSLIIAGWIDEKQVLETIKHYFSETSYLLDTHTAVGAALCRKLHPLSGHMVITSTASPYKLSCDVLAGITNESYSDEFECIRRISSLSNTPQHRAVANLRERKVIHSDIITIEEMKESVRKIIDSIRQ